jgi:hypothetical protein
LLARRKKSTIPPDQQQLNGHVCPSKESLFIELGPKAIPSFPRCIATNFLLGVRELFHSGPIDVYLWPRRAGFLKVDFLLLILKGDTAASFFGE